MSKILSVESAYAAIAEEIVSFANNRAWAVAGGKYSIFNTMVSSEWWFELHDLRDERGVAPPIELSVASSDAVRFLRENLIKTTGQRIWGLTFTLQSDGTFQVEYDYNKPEGYEETEETIEVDSSKGILKN